MYRQSSKPRLIMNYSIDSKQVDYGQLIPLTSTTVYLSTPEKHNKKKTESCVQKNSHLKCSWHVNWQNIEVFYV